MSIDVLMDEIMAEKAPILKVRNQQADFNSSCKGPVVEADRMMLIQVIMNLLSNSSKYSPPESVIEIKVERDTYHMIFNIKDKGIG